MRKIYFILLYICLLLACTGKQPLTSYVNPMIGTDGTGHTYPGATMPFGMVQLSPDTKLSGWQGCSGYHYEDSLIYGFSHTHLSGTGCEDYCDVLVMPQVGDVHWDNEDYKSAFRHETEKASPGYYAVTLDKYGIKAELTVTNRVGLHKYTFPKDTQGYILIDLKHRNKLLQSRITLNGKNEVSGCRISRQWARERRVFFVARFSQPFVAEQIQDSTKVALTFDLNDKKPLLVKVAISSVSVDNARQNLETELPEWDFEQCRKAADAAWDAELSKVEVEGGTKAERINFYTALYHAFIVPNLYMDVNSEFSGRGGKTGIADGDNYTVFSLWDTYRAAHPLYTILQPKRNEDFIRSFLRLYDQGGLLPVWELAGNETFCMIGHHAVSVIADAYTKGYRGFDVEKAYAACRKSADTTLFGLPFFIAKGYIPLTEESESVSKTLEYAYNAWCIAQMAKTMGKEADYAEYIQRAQYYKNIYDPEAGFMRAKSNETWVSPFDPREVNFNYTEANAWQYSFYVPQDISGLAALHGGKEKLAAVIDEMFAAATETTGRHQSDITGLIGQYAHGNEPSHQMAYLYNYLGRPWKTQAMVRRIMDELYTPQNDGLCGNEDCGQMSAWYVLSAMGFYQMAPGTPYYTIGSPLFKKVTIHLDNGRQFVIKADKPSSKNCCIQSATFNGNSFTKSYFTHADLLMGGELTFKMRDTPNVEWGVGEENEPVSAITDHIITPVPALRKGAITFSKTDTLVLEAMNNALIYYTLDGSKPTTTSKLYTDPILIQESATLRAIAVQKGFVNKKLSDSTYSSVQTAVSSKEIKASFAKIPDNWTLTLENPYSQQYPAGGDKALIDKVFGARDFRSATWQGYYGVDLIATVDLGKQQLVREVSIGFIQAAASWIFFPPQVEFFTSDNGDTFTSIGIIKTPIDEHTMDAIYRFTQRIGKQARFVRIVGKYFGPCPDWHPGAGYRSWLFADEITIK